MSLLDKAWGWVCDTVIPAIHWNWTVGMWHHGKFWRLTDEDWKICQDLLKKDYHVILLRRNTHLTTYLVGIANRIKLGQWGFWSHAFLNVEEDDNFKLIEATGTGTHYSLFPEVFNCDSVCFLRPKGFTAEDWTKAMGQAIADLGKPYDDLFNINQDQELSCVELVRNALMAAGVDYQKDFQAFEAMIQKVGYLTPDMLYNCPDFQIVLEIRR